MELKELKVYSEASNQAVICATGRRYPGSLIHGDSLSILCAEAKEISEVFRMLQPADDDLLHLVQDHQEKLLSRIIHYQKVLTEHGIELPYSERASEHDLVRLVPDEE